MKNTPAHTAKVFNDLHHAEGIFLMPNAGSASLLETAGFPALGTSSAGIAFCLGQPDYEEALSRAEALEETLSIGGSLARATLGLICRAAQEIRSQESFEFANGQIPDSELCEYFSARRAE